MKTRPEARMDALVRSAINEHLATIARSKGALWDGHASIYAQHRAWLTTLLDIEPFVVAMHPSFSDLDFSMQNEYECKWRNECNEAVLYRGKSGSQHSGIEQIWVKASSSRYREALLHILADEMRKADVDRHNAAASVFEECIEEVKNGTSEKKKLSDVDRAQLIARLTDLKVAHKEAACAVPQPDLMADFDHTLNGDHVFSASALKHLPEAWVWLFPVPANANQGFGAKVEKHYLKLCRTSSARTASAGMIYKLLASAMPKAQCESDAIVAWIRNQLGKSAAALEQTESIWEFVHDNFQFDADQTQPHVGGDQRDNLQSTP